MLGKREAQKGRAVNCNHAAVRIPSDLRKKALNFLKTRITHSSVELSLTLNTCPWDGEVVWQLAPLEHRVPVPLLQLVAGLCCC